MMGGTPTMPGISHAFRDHDRPDGDAGKNIWQQPLTTIERKPAQDWQQPLRDGSGADGVDHRFPLDWPGALMCCPRSVYIRHSGLLGATLMVAGVWLWMRFL
jgi:hypothetical protein